MNIFFFSFQKNISSDSKHHFRHDRLNRGICMNWCKARFKDFVKSAKMRYYVEEFENETEVTQMHLLYKKK